MIEIANDLIWFPFHRFNQQQIAQGHVAAAFEHALTARVITLDDLSGRKIVFNSLSEGHGPTQAQSVLDSFVTFAWFQPQRAVFLNNVNDRYPADIKHVSWPWYMVDHTAWLTSFQSTVSQEVAAKDRDVIYLARRPSMLRETMLALLLDRFPRHRLIISYGSMCGYSWQGDLCGQSLPILIDGVSFGDRMIQQHRASDPEFFRSWINVVAESSNQEPDGSSWTSVFVTEKTMKCFAWRQIPVWWTVPGFVDAVRQMGFDVFDDIMDHHRYDTIIDPNARSHALVDTVAAAIDRIHTGTEDFRDRTIARLNNNHQQLQRLGRNRLAHWNHIIREIHAA